MNPPRILTTIPGGGRVQLRENVLPTRLHPNTLTPFHRCAPDICNDLFYVTNTKKGRGKSRRKGKTNGDLIPITYWGSAKERERDYCEPDPANVTDPENACCEAPKGSLSPEGATLYNLGIEPGWYRHSPYSVEVMQCRHKFECKGSTKGSTNFTTDMTTGNTSNFTTQNASEHNLVNASASAVVATVSAGQDLCAYGYTGPMCGRCQIDPPHYRASFSKECVECTKPELSFTIILIAAVVVAIIVYAVFERDSISRFYDRVSAELY